MGKIVFYTDQFIVGGVERLLVDIFNYFDLYDKSEVEMILALSVFSGYRDEMKEQLLSPQKIKYLFTEKEVLDSLEIKKNRKSNFIGKLKYNKDLTTTPKKRVKRLNSLLGNDGIFIDFKGILYKKIDKIKALKKVIFVHESLSEYRVKNMSPNELQRYGKQLEKYDLIIVICENMKLEYLKYFPELKQKINIIFNPCDIDRIHMLSEEYVGLKIEEKQVLDRNFILAVGRFEIKAKDYLTLLKAYKIALEQGINEYLYIIGEGEDRPLIENWIKEYGLDEKVVLLGKQYNPYIWMKHAKLFIHSSNHEGFGLVLVEALSLGKKVISTNCPVGPSEILQNGRYGYLTPVGDEKIMASTIVKALSEEKYDSEELMQYANKFNINEIAKLYKNAFEISIIDN